MGRGGLCDRGFRHEGPYSKATHDHGGIDNFATIILGIGREVLRSMIRAADVGGTTAYRVPGINI